jgi:hypothetical protein
LSAFKTPVRSVQIGRYVESSIKCKLRKAAIPGRTDVNIQCETNKLFEAFREEEEGGKKGDFEVLTQGDVDRLMKQEEDRNAEESSKEVLGEHSDLKLRLVAKIQDERT